jgi:hypothetical protein
MSVILKVDIRSKRKRFFILATHSYTAQKWGHGTIKQPEFKRREHPPCDQDLAPCDFFLFGYMKE